MKKAEFHSSELPSEKVKKTFDATGCILVRQLFLPRVINALYSDIKSAYTRAASDFVKGKMSKDVYKKTYQFGHLPTEYFPPKLENRLLNKDSYSVLSCLLPSPIYIIETNTLPRSQSSQHPERAIPFHQDAEFLGPLSRAINMWVPLTSCGRKAPGVELLPIALHDFFYSSPLDLGRPLMEQRTYEVKKKEDLWRPKMAPGDALFFHHYTLHRTHLTSKMSQERLSFELRFTTSGNQDLTRSKLRLFHI